MTEGAAFLGKYKVTSTENIDEYMKEIGVGFALRKVGNTVKPELDILIAEDGTWTLKTTSTFKNVTLEFKLGVPFQEDAVDGRKLENTFTLESPTRLIQKQKGLGPKDKDSELIREIVGNDMIVTMKSGSIEGKRVYTKV